MDSLTQIALGAAVGELVGGKKLGNKAMFWGAVAGTIPDLDVFMKYVLYPIDALAAHRGFSHSFVFAILMSFVLAYSINSIYHSKWYKTIASGTYYALIILVLIGINRFLFQSGRFHWMYLIISGLVMAGSAWLLYRKYSNENIFIPNVPISSWRWLFFWALVTHPMLDCFTAYGTQILLPFSNYRVAFNNISVVDPIYTIFLIAGTMIAARLSKSSEVRRKVNIAGIILSSLYMILTLYNKYSVGKTFEKSMAEKNIDYSRYMTNPTMFNNLLWYGIAETDTSFYYGFYSLLDNEKKFILSSKPKTRDLLLQHHEDHTIKTLNWFSKSYNITESISEDTTYYYDMRFGPLLIDGKEIQPFKMVLVKKLDGTFEMIDNTPSKRKDIDMKKAMSALVKRIGL